MKHLALISCSILLSITQVSGQNVIVPKQKDSSPQQKKLLIDELTSWEHAPSDYVTPKGLIRGGAFKDRILPMPVGKNGLRSDVWGDENVKPRNVENGIEDPLWSFWCRSVHKEDDGKYHLIGARWLESKGFDAWPTSRVYHAVSDSPTGPFKVIDPDIGRGHNVTYFRTKDGKYIISGLFEDYIASTINGPWKKRKITYDFRGGTCPDDSNNTFTSREDGSVLMINQPGRVWISEDGLKPFRKVTDNHGGHPCTLGIFEDPIIWRDEVQYNVIFNDWYGRTAYYMRSKDGVNWVWDQGIAYDINIAKHPDGSAERWYKYERPSVLVDEYGRATHIYFAVIDSRKDYDKPNDNHNTKNIALPLIVQRRLELPENKPVWGKNIIQVRIKAEKGFNPKKDVKLSSLLFGSPSTVDFGKGLKPIKSKMQGDDLIVTFSGEYSGFTKEDFVGKLIGSDKNDKLVFGYVRLPGVSFNEPILNANRPIIKNGEANFIIENFGMSASKQGKLTLKLHKTGEQKVTETKVMIPEIAAYGHTQVAIPIDLSTLRPNEQLNAEFIIEGGGKPFVHQETFQIIKSSTDLQTDLTLQTAKGEQQKGPFCLATQQEFKKGIAIHSPSTTTWLIDGSYDELQLTTGAAQGSLGGSVLEIWGDGKLLTSTQLLRPKSIYKEAHEIKVPIRGIHSISIVTNRFFVNDLADKASAHVILGEPKLVKKNEAK